MRSKQSIKMLMALAVLSFCAQSCEKDDLTKFRQHKNNDWHQSDSTTNDSTRKDSTGKKSDQIDSSKSDSTGRDSSTHDSTGTGGSIPGFFKESFMDTFANTYDLVTYDNPKTVGGVNYYHRSHKVYEWFGSSAPKSLSNLKVLNTFTESNLYFWQGDSKMWLK